MADDSYTYHHCPECGANNVVALGDTDDCTSSMGEAPGCKCWYCNHEFWRYDHTDRDYRIWLEVCGFDEKKTPEENLKELGSDDGKPTEDFYSDDFERFLDSDSIMDGYTWRGWIMQWLDIEANKIRQDKTHVTFDVLALKRPERIRVVESVCYDMHFPTDKQRETAREALAKGFSGHDGMDCREFTEKRKKNGGWAKGKVDIDRFRRKLEDLLRYMLGFGWFEIKREERLKKK